jgi:hypothetical protein
LVVRAKASNLGDFVKNGLGQMALRIFSSIAIRKIHCLSVASLDFSAINGKI